MKVEGDTIECSFGELLGLKEKLQEQGQRILSVKINPKGYTVKTVSILETKDLFDQTPGFLPDYN